MDCCFFWLGLRQKYGYNPDEKTVFRRKADGKKSNPSKLPPPNAAFRSNDQTGDITPAEVRGMVCNPVYAGFGPYPGLISDEEWVAAAAKAIEKEGAEQFLVNLLHVLRETFAEED